MARSALTLGVVWLTAASAHAGTPTPELDPSSLGSGVALASAVILLLTHRGRPGRSDDSDRE